MISILSTKTLSASERNLFTDRGFFLEIAPMIQVLPTLSSDELLPLIREGVPETCVFTSKSAAEIYVKAVEGLSDFSPGKICALAPATSEIIENAGFNVFIKGDSAADLAEKIIQAGDIRSVHFFCGNKRMQVLPSQLKEAGIIVKETLVYETIKTPRPLEFLNFDAVLFFSPAAVESFFSKNHLPVHTAIFSIGKTTEKTIKAYTSCPVFFPPTPSLSLLPDMIEAYLTNSNLR
ncbi:MAG: uroporphyrinogen-III synthase [Bacteroidia bacterium]|nr:uroporphyrinogen-III synthase [Bacteroidia bacterium]